MEGLEKRCKKRGWKKGSGKEEGGGGNKKERGRRKRLGERKRRLEGRKKGRGENVGKGEMRRGGGKERTGGGKGGEVEGGEGGDKGRRGAGRSGWKTREGEGTFCVCVSPIPHHLSFTSIHHVNRQRKKQTFQLHPFTIPESHPARSICLGNKAMRLRRRLGGRETRGNLDIEGERRKRDCRRGNTAATRRYPMEAGDS